MSVTPFVLITDETTLADLHETLRLLTDGAEAISRQGKAAMLSERYDVQHARIDAILDEIRSRTTD